MRKLLPLVLALLSVLGLSACDIDKEAAILMAAGSYGDIAIVVSSKAMAGSLDGFKQSFNDEFTFVISREPRFNIEVFTPDRWEQCKGYKNIIFVWRVGDGGPVEKMLRDRLTEAGEDRVLRGTPTVLEFKEPFANYQYAVIVASTDRNSLISHLQRNATKLRDQIEEKSTARILRRYRHEGLATRLMTDLWIRHRFYLEIPVVFQLNQEMPGGYPAVELLRTGPSRGITVGWSQSSDPDILLSQPMLLLELRKELGLKMHHEDLVPSSLVWKEDIIGGLPAVRLEGAWNSRSFDGGGPFWCWFVADHERQRVICIDTLCYAPGAEKMNHFRRLRAIVSTFSLQPPQP